MSIINHALNNLKKNEDLKEIEHSKRAVSSQIKSQINRYWSKKGVLITLIVGVGSLLFILMSHLNFSSLYQSAKYFFATVPQSIKWSSTAQQLLHYRALNKLNEGDIHGGVNDLETIISINPSLTSVKETRDRVVSHYDL